MSFKLFFMRHAEAVDSSSRAQDKDRELTEHGKNQALEAADFLKKYKIKKCVVSTSTRTEQTANILDKQLSFSEIDYMDELYSDPEEVIMDEVILMQTDEFHDILFVGHNPTIYKIALSLADNNCQLYEDFAMKPMNPASIVGIEFNIKTLQDLESIKGEIISIFNATA